MDSYLTVEANNVNYIQQQQAQFRVNSYEGLMDHIHKQAEHEGKQPCNVVILPSSFHGLARGLQQHYQDVLVIVGKHGKPNLFFTFTCNPKSKDSVNNIPPGQTAGERLDIVVRVFKMHLKELI